jgi:hypothetical protein
MPKGRRFSVALFFVDLCVALTWACGVLRGKTMPMAGVGMAPNTLIDFAIQPHFSSFAYLVAHC